MIQWLAMTVCVHYVPLPLCILLSCSKKFLAFLASMALADKLCISLWRTIQNTKKEKSILIGWISCLRLNLFWVLLCSSCVIPALGFTDHRTVGELGLWRDNLQSVTDFLKCIKQAYSDTKPQAPQGNRHSCCLCLLRWKNLNYTPMNGEDRLLFTDEPVEFEK